MSPRSAEGAHYTLKITSLDNFFLISRSGPRLVDLPPPPLLLM